MNCSNCGAPLKLALDRRYYACEYCTTIHFPAENQDGIRPLEAPSGLLCPVCKTPLLHAWVDETTAQYCEKCRGLLLPQFQFLITLQYLRARAALAPLPPRPFNPQELERQVSCPQCRQPMDTHPYGGPGNIVVDNCPHCELIWLDSGELSRVVNAPERDRGYWL